jgi:hypothetical protein
MLLIAACAYKTTAMGILHPGSWVLLAISCVLLYVVREMLWIMWSPLGDTHAWKQKLLKEKEKRRVSEVGLGWRAELRIQIASNDPYFDVRQYCRNMVADINRIRDVALGVYA